MTNRAKKRLVLYSLALILLFGLGAGSSYQKQLDEARFQTERLRTARLRYEDWSAFTSHLTEDRRYPQRPSLSMSGSKILSDHIIGPAPLSGNHSPPPKSAPLSTVKPGCE